ncbi:TadE/TadG family type IV pilus assembly protein [Aurantimonas sp. A2-1-M11]|uniref:TadE/TadG family type IV pilus assembly protein n=1 Tax=Aurantimonas sp. A2-1-M11 TaxID=3113712 RepID=UPI002F9412EE
MRTFLTDRSGSIAVITAILLPILVGAFGFGAEVGYWLSVDRKMSQVADVTAYSTGAAFLMTSQDANILRKNAWNVAQKAGLTSADVEILTLLPVDTGVDQIEVTIKRTLPRFFSAIFVQEPVQLEAKSIVALQLGEPACVLALSQTAPDAIKNWGSADSRFEKCLAASNSESETAIHVGGGSVFKAGCVSTVGNVVGINPIDLGCPAPKVKQPPTVDPYKDVPVPTATQIISLPECKEISSTGSGENSIAVWSPGRCRSPVDWKAQTTYLFPGVYVFERGLTLQGKVLELPEDQWRSSYPALEPGVTLVFLEGSNLRAKGQASINITAPTSGPGAGFAIYKIGEQRKFAGGVELDLAGVLYAPQADLEFLGSSALGGSDCVRLIANTITFTGSNSFTSDCGPGGGAAFGTLEGLFVGRKFEIVQ